MALQDMKKQYLHSIEKKPKGHFWAIISKSPIVFKENCGSKVNSFGHWLESWASEGGQGGLGPPWILKLSAKRGCFFSFEG